MQLEDWIVDSQYFKEYLGKGREFAARAALETRSERLVRQDRPRRSMFSAFAWKV